MPHLGRTPQHLMRSPVCPGGRAWRLASRLAVRTGAPRCRRRSCKSLFAPVGRCLWAPASAANMGMDAEDGYRPLGRPRPRLHTQWPLGTLSEAGRASLARSMPRRTRRRQESRRQTADAPTSWCTAHRPSSSPFVAMPRWLAPLPDIALRMAESRKRATYPELQRGGGQRLFLERWLAGACPRACPGPGSPCAASNAWTRRWWGMLSTAVQHSVGGTALGAPWLVSNGALGASLPWTTCWGSLSQLARAASLSAGLAHHDRPHDSVTRLRTAECFSGTLAPEHVIEGGGGSEAYLGRIARAAGHPIASSCVIYCGIHLVIDAGACGADEITVNAFPMHARRLPVILPGLFRVAGTRHICACSHTSLVGSFGYIVSQAMLVCRLRLCCQRQRRRKAREFRPTKGYAKLAILVLPRLFATAKGVQSFKSFSFFFRAPFYYSESTGGPSPGAGYVRPLLSAAVSQEGGTCQRASARSSCSSGLGPSL